MKDQYKLSNGYNLESTCDMAIYTFGRKHQEVKAIEELGELIQALACSIIRGNHNVEEESADCEIMIYQLKKVYGCKTHTYSKPITIHGAKGILMIIKDLSYLITELTRSYNGYDHNVRNAIYQVDEALLHIREIYHVAIIEKYKYAKLERLCKNILKHHRSRSQ